MNIAIPRETFPGEKRVAVVPTVVPGLKKAGLDVLVEKGAGQAAGFTDEEYVGKGARIVDDRAELFRTAEVVLCVRAVGDAALLRPGLVVIGLADPLAGAKAAAELAKTGATLLAMELMPRITRAQSMDALSRQATVAGYKAVLMAADALPRMFPMLMTAAGTISPAHVFV
ncbi:MAG: NAD(P)(+) transhydrogenase (Re/Si-specific) subunit alpha, partial [Planctomycetota bacterium]|nr:NAD(P)(+) transhydrogenase (Re/Si-specific) subunit alpha [Planctomycetota bacterium]